MPTITTNVNTDAIDRFLAQIRSLDQVNFEPLMKQWEEILHDDNTAGALGGLDGYGQPLIPVSYRPDPSAGSREPIDYSIKPNNNLTSGHYRTLDGPPLAPRGLDSRIVTEFATRWLNPEPGVWITEGGWARQDIVNIEGVPFLRFHFDGPDHNPNLPVRDLANVRPTALQLARDTMSGFVMKLVARIKGI